MKNTKDEKIIQELKEEATILMGEGTNLEYNRGICELIAFIDYVEEKPQDERAQEIAEELGVVIN